MLPETQNLVLESIAEALQTMAFVMVEPAEGALPAPADARVYAVAFRGPGAAGEVQIAAPRGLGELLAVNMLALEPGSTEAAERAEDVLKELCNISAGLLLRRRGPAVADSVEMSLPASRDLPPALWADFVVGAVVFLADGFPVAIAVKEQV